MKPYIVQFYNTPDKHEFIKYINKQDYEAFFYTSFSARIRLETEDIILLKIKFPSVTFYPKTESGIQKSNS